AKAVGTSPRVLLYYFKSKEALIVEVLQGARMRQRQLFAALKVEHDARAADACRAIWSVMSAPKAEAVFRLFFEVYALALQDRARFEGFLQSAVEDWLLFLEAPRVREGYKRADARAIATVIVAGFRGFMLDLCATHDRKRIQRAFELWLVSIERIPTPKELAA
ncbi:MAG: TetR/AcrR family transcriptional regulator, partial [Candidatus Eremiobacteraeota bacterium]|nr:TetR/AcrR family transcriptional regulator [Candidatus Eremiobacteraeota bacterium]